MVAAMSFTPASSIGSGSGGGGVVEQGARDASAQAWLVDGSAVTQPVSGPLTAAELVAAEPLTVDASGATVPVSGPMTDAEFAAHLPLDVTATVEAPEGAATEQTLAELLQSMQNTELVLRLYASRMIDADLTDVAA